METTPLTCQRDKFIIHEGVSYMNSSHISPLLKSVEEALQQEKVYIAKGVNRIRLAPHVYNDTDEIDRLFEVLAHYLK